MTITPEMIHDALDAFHSLPDRSPLYDDMSAALEAVVPHIEAALRAQIASEIEAMPVDGTEGIIIRDDAARIARGKD